MLFGGWDVGSRWQTVSCYLWGTSKMKLGLEVAVAAVAVATAQANCPDYTTYAQVNMLPPR
jgi:hypothetical protein